MHIKWVFVANVDSAFDTLVGLVDPLIGNLRLYIQGYVDQEDFFISPLKHQDVL